METPTLIFCGGGNRRFAEIATRNGFKYGSTYPYIPYLKPYFLDQNWKDPQKEKYMSYLSEHTPNIATVLDLETKEDFDEVISWAEQASRFVTEEIIIIPKLLGCIDDIPKTVGGKKIRLGYSVPTRYGKTKIPIDDFGDREVHLLGGSPQKQMELFGKMNVVSVDGNMMLYAATRFCGFWVPGTATFAKSRWWPTLMEYGFDKTKDAPYIAFEKSCIGIFSAWSRPHEIQ